MRRYWPASTSITLAARVAGKLVDCMGGVPSTFGGAVDVNDIRLKPAASRSAVKKNALVSRPSDAATSLEITIFDNSGPAFCGETKMPFAAAFMNLLWV